MPNSSADFFSTKYSVELKYKIFPFTFYNCDSTQITSTQIVCNIP